MPQLGDLSQISNSGLWVRGPKLRRAPPADGDSGRNLNPELGPVPDPWSDVGSDPLRSVEKPTIILITEGFRFHPSKSNLRRKVASRQQVGKLSRGAPFGERRKWERERMSERERVREKVREREWVSERESETESERERVREKVREWEWEHKCF